MNKAIYIGISACLLGHPVRWDGGHKLDRLLIDAVGRLVNFIPVCPEAECGLGVPREPLHLKGEPKNPLLIETPTGTDHAGRMLKWTEKRLTELEQNKLCGFIFKSSSPSCGLKGVRVYDEWDRPAAEGTGLFATAFLTHFPRMPAEDADRLHDPRARKIFIENILAFRKLSRIASSRSGGKP